MCVSFLASDFDVAYETINSVFALTALSNSIAARPLMMAIPEYDYYTKMTRDVSRGRGPGRRGGGRRRRCVAVCLFTDTFV